jgi:hypothetical protein
MPTTSFQEWVEKKTEESEHSDRSIRVREWTEAYAALTQQIISWLRSEGGPRIVFDTIPIERSEHGLGHYRLTKLRIAVGDDYVEVVPMGRNVIGSFGLRGEPEHRGAGRADITNGARKYPLYRTIQNGRDVWYVVGDRSEISLLSKDVLCEIVMDLMS